MFYNFTIMHYIDLICYFPCHVSVNKPTPSKDRSRIVYYSLLGILQFTGIELDQGNS